VGVSTKEGVGDHSCVVASAWFYLASVLLMCSPNRKAAWRAAAPIVGSVLVFGCGCSVELGMPLVSMVLWQGTCCSSPLLLNTVPHALFMVRIAEHTPVNPSL
jgi:hypothetical protein